ncbi:DUF5977 domain-containing protein [Parasediminibacterium paludis]|uniref:DUF5977 domain-containing protein n=1 Tax=Parasediminibacterium paludis TaxID=908966 RepID=A0ABV8PV96_9BACT
MKRILQILFFIVLCSKVNSQVNLQTGSATYSLPMFNWKDDKSRLNSVVALNYNSGNGLKVNDVSSNIGQGWNLVAGGVITRMQVGEPDDQMRNDGNGTDQDLTKYPAGYLYATRKNYTGCPVSLTKYPIYGAMNQLYTQTNTTAEDRQQDYFAFQFNGKTGMFVLDPVNGDNGLTIGDSKLKITFQRDPSMVTNTTSGIRTTITSFTIQDVDGLIYKFRQHGLTKVLHAGYCDATLSQELSQPNFADQGVYHQTGFDDGQLINPYVIGSWYLSEIDDPFTTRSIIITYNNNYINTISGIDISYNIGSKGYAIISHKRSISTTPDIASISYPDGHQVIFNYANNKPRVDLVGEYPLSSVDILYNGRYLSEYQLNTTYFILNRYGTPVTNYQKSVARLCLKSVKKIGVDLKEDTPPYIFDYYLGSSNGDDFVPPPFFYAKDIFGFYNGNNSTDYNGNPIALTNTDVSQLSFDALRGICFIKAGSTKVFINPKNGYAKNGLLKQIIYPTGGTLTYTYSQNQAPANSLGSNVTYASNTNNLFIGGVSVSQTSSTDGGYSNGCNNPIITKYNYVLSDLVTSSIWGLETPVNFITSSSHYESEKKQYRWPPVPFGECYWQYEYPGILSQQEAIGLSDIQNVMNFLAPVLNIVSAIGTIEDIDAIVTAVSGGTAIPVMALIDIIVDLISVGLSCFSSNNAKDYTSTVYYNNDLNGASPLPMQYKRVEVIEGNGTIGKTVQEYTSSDDYAIWIPANMNTDFSSKQRFAAWAYGLPKITTVFDVNNNPVKQTINYYDASYAQQLIEPLLPKSTAYQNINAATGVPSSLISCKCSVYKSYSQRNVDWSDPNFNTNTTFNLTSNSDLGVDFYGIYTGHMLLSQTNERVYSTTDATQYLETITNYNYYQYSSFNQLDASQITTKQSNGDVYNKFILYNGNINSGILATLVNNNIFSIPIETKISVIKAGVTTGATYLSEHVTEYTTLANGDIKPYRTLEQRFNQPQPLSSISFYDVPNSAKNPPYKQTQLYSYDASGNLIGMQDEGGHTVSNIYDYNDKYVVASVINANPLIDKAAYSSFETTGLGGWLLNGTAAYLTSGGITGNNLFVLSASNSLSAPLNANKAYILSFWASNMVSVSSGSLLKSTPTINGLTYYEYAIPSGVSSVTVSGNSNIDELRLFPQNARMRTVTYDPLIGKTSECDENNRITYYQYDNLGRLRFVQDENKSVVKMYEYNNVSAAKLTGCPTTFTNNLITEYFDKTNCGSGYYGTRVAYSVPAGRYSSTISQQDVDAKAELDLNTNGPINAANTFACSIIYYNSAKTATVYSQNCALGYSGGAITYTVPANKYSSIISQADADQKATIELNANAQAYANMPAHKVCVINTNPNWQADPSAPTQCGSGTQAGHILILARDINPNSPTYNTTQYMDQGASATCGIPVIVNSTIPGASFQITLTNAITGDTYTNSFSYTYNNSQTLIFSVPAGTYNVAICPTNYMGGYFYSIYNNSNIYFGSGNTCSNTYGAVIASSDNATIYINAIGQIE